MKKKKTRTLNEFIAKGFGKTENETISIRKSGWSKIKPLSESHEEKIWEEIDKKGFGANVSKRDLMRNIINYDRGWMELKKELDAALVMHREDVDSLMFGFMQSVLNIAKGSKNSRVTELCLGEIKKRMPEFVIYFCNTHGLGKDLKALTLGDTKDFVKVIKDNLRK